MIKKIGFAMWLVAMASQSFAKGGIEISGVRVWTAPDHTRLVFETNGAAEHNVMRLQEPDRLVLDIKDAKFKKIPDSKLFTNQRVAGMTYALKDGKDLRIVLDLKSQIRPKSFSLKPGGQYGHRLVLDLFDQSEAAQEEPKVVKTLEDSSSLRDIIVAIDAGHGGDDPGALGKKKHSQEKDVTLAIARQIKKLVDAQPGMRAVLTRDGDYYIGLRKRTEIAREKKADLFVSIHADAAYDSSARGASVFVLSRKGASSEAARWLADRENAADFAGGVSLDDKDDVLASVLLDLAQTGTQSASQSAASRVHSELSGISKLHGNMVQNAGFMVLKSPDIPSMLVETGFISNPDEERKLTTSSYQQSVAKAVFQGILGYFNEAPPIGTRLAASKFGSSTKVDVAQSSPARPSAENAKPIVVAQADTKSAVDASAARSKQLREAAEDAVNASLQAGKAEANSNAKLAAAGSNAPANAKASSKGSDKYVIKAGDTLVRIADKHQVTLAALRQENNLAGDKILTGQVLRIPEI